MAKESIVAAPLIAQYAPPLMTKAIALFLAAFIGAASYVSADVLAQYDFTLGTLSSDSDPNSSAGSFGTGTGITGSLQTTQGSTAGNPSFGTPLSDIDAATTSAAITNSEYFTFTITPESGFTFTLDSISFSYQVGITGTTGTQNVTFALFSSATGFSIANQISAFTYTEDSDGNVSTGSTDAFVNTGTITLPAATFANIGATEFRIYVSDGGSTSTSLFAKVDNVILNGTTVAIPEPSTYAMMGLGAALLVGVQRFRPKTS